MTSFRLNNDPRPTSDPDVWVRDVPMGVRRQIVDAAERCRGSTENIPEDEISEFVALLFREVIVAENGERYENVVSKEDVGKMGMDRLVAVQEAVMEALAPGKRSKKTAPSPQRCISSSPAKRQAK